nr:conotoxin precursor SF-mi2 [Conus judaeus]
MRFYLLLTVTLLLTLSTGGDDGPRFAKGLQKHIVRRDCQAGCVGCYYHKSKCCCGEQVCVNHTYCVSSTDLEHDRLHHAAKTVS